MTHFVMPPDGIQPSIIEGHFRPQAACLQQRGFTVSIVRDDVFTSRAEIRGIPIGASVVYRGWMVRPDEY